jgi:hypothetical protein
MARFIANVMYETRMEMDMKKNSMRKGSRIRKPKLSRR